MGNCCRPTGVPLGETQTVQAMAFGLTFGVIAICIPKAEGADHDGMGGG